MTIVMCDYASGLQHGNCSRSTAPQTVRLASICAVHGKRPPVQFPVFGRFPVRHVHYYCGSLATPFLDNQDADLRALRKLVRSHTPKTLTEDVKKDVSAF